MPRGYTVPILKRTANNPPTQINTSLFLRSKPLYNIRFKMTKTQMVVKILAWYQTKECNLPFSYLGRMLKHGVTSNTLKKIKINNNKICILKLYKTKMMISMNK